MTVRWWNTAPALRLGKYCLLEQINGRPARSLSTQHRAQLQVFLYPPGATVRRGPGSPHYRDFTTTPRHTTLGRTPLGTRSVRCRDLYLTRNSTHTTQTSMTRFVFEPALPASERLQTHALDRVASGIGQIFLYCCVTFRSIFVWSRYRPGVAQRVGRGIALLFYDRGTRRGRVVSSTLRRALSPGKTRYPFYRRLGGPQGWSGRAENLFPTGIRSRTVLTGPLSGVSTKKCERNLYPIGTETSTVAFYTTTAGQNRLIWSSFRFLATMTTEPAAVIM